VQLCEERRDAVVAMSGQGMTEVKFSTLSRYIKLSQNVLAAMLASWLLGTVFCDWNSTLAQSVEIRIAVN